MAAKRPSRAVLMLTIVAAPVALGFETLLRLLLFPPEFEDIRMWLRPTLAPYAWALAAVAALFVLLGFAIQRRLTLARIARAKDRDKPDGRYRVAFGIFLLTSSVPQIPAILSTFTFMFGAPIWPVLASIAFCSVGVVGQAFRVGTLADTWSGR